MMIYQIIQYGVKTILEDIKKKKIIFDKEPGEIIENIDTKYIK